MYQTFIGSQIKLRFLIDFYYLQHIQRVLDSPNFARSLDTSDGGQIGHLFLVGGFAESAIVQEAIRAEFGQAMNVIIPQVCSKVA